MSTLYSMVEPPELESPALIMVLKGWIDAGLAADGAADVLTDNLALTTVARFDADALLDWRARRPIMRLENGLNTQISWDETEMSWARDPAGNDLLLLVGNEPDHAWLSFSEQVVDLAVDLGVRMVVGLGAYPTPVPHTRPPLLSGTASSSDLLDGLVANSVEVPTGVQGLIERRAAIRGLPALGLWAQVPHYVSAMPYPAASLALLEGTNRVAGLQLPLADLTERASASRARIDELIGANPEHHAMLQQLEKQADEQATTTEMSAASGDQLVAELERYLREQS
ncbi:MAG: PAC2 family protein [Acidimicrobiales bacterium]